MSLSIAQALDRAAADEVEIPNYPLRFRVRPITTALLMEAGGAILLAAKPATEDVQDYTKRILADPKKATEGVIFMEAAACAGIVAASKDGGKAWEEIRFTRDRTQNNPNGGLLHLSALPPNAISLIGAAVMSLSMDGGAAGERLTTFLGGSEAPVRGAGKKGREVAARGS